MHTCHTTQPRILIYALFSDDHTILAFKLKENTMTNTLETHLLGSIKNLYKNADDYDVVLEIGQEPNVKAFQAHSVILRAVSPYFKVALSKGLNVKDEGRLVFKKPNIAPDAFTIIL